MRKDMNFFSQFDGKKKGKSGLDIYVYLACGIILLAIIGTAIWNSTAIFLTNKSIDDYNMKLNEPEMVANIKKSNDINIKTDALMLYDKGITSIIQAVDSRAVVSTILLNKISSTLPGVSLNNIDITSTQIAITATAKKWTDIAEFEHNLSKLDIVQSAHIDGIAGIDIFTFNIKCSLKDVE